jgi:serine/threonine-protein kinase RsbW
MSPPERRLVRLEFTSAFEMLDLVQVIGDNISKEFGLTEDEIHWVGVSVRESVINAMKHGNRYDAGKHVFVEFETTNWEMTIRVRDQGEGFEPQEVPDPLARENLLKTSGRGLFLIRNFMDDVRLERAPEGGMVMQMTKRIQPASGVKDSVKT